MKTPGQILFEVEHRGYRYGDHWTEDTHLHEAYEKRAQEFLAEMGSERLAQLVEWVPVGERLPEKRGPYTVCHEPPSTWVHESFFDIKEYGPDGWGHIGVTHWALPLKHPQQLREGQG